MILGSATMIEKAGPGLLQNTKLRMHVCEKAVAYTSNNGPFNAGINHMTER